MEVASYGNLTSTSRPSNRNLYGSGYVSRKDFWTLGLIFGATYLAVLLVIGVPYLGSTWDREWIDDGCRMRNSGSQIPSPYFPWFLAESHPAGPYRENWSDYSKGPQVLDNPQAVSM
jgi:hypothetical protein